MGFKGVNAMKQDVRGRYRSRMLDSHWAELIESQSRFSLRNAGAPWRRLALCTDKPTSNMRAWPLLPHALLVAAIPTRAAAASILSCSSEAATADPCEIPMPGGLFVFRQRFEPDVGDAGSWNIQGLDVLEYVSRPQNSRRTLRHRRLTRWS